MVHIWDVERVVEHHNVVEVGAEVRLIENIDQYMLHIKLQWARLTPLEDENWLPAVLGRLAVSENVALSGESGGVVAETLLNWYTIDSNTSSGL